METFVVDEAALELRTWVCVAGVAVRVSTNSESVLRSFRTRKFLQQPDAAFSINVAVRTGARSKYATPYFRGMAHLVFMEFGPDDVFVIDLLRRRIDGIVKEQLATDINFWNKLFVPICMGVLGPTVGVIPVHSACLIHNSTGLLLAGQSGSGKSTLAVALAREGLGFISDDWTYVTHAADGLVAHGLRAPIKLLPGSDRYFPELRGRSPETSLNGELAFEVCSCDLGFSYEDTCYPKHIVFVERTPGSSVDLEPLEREQVLAYFTSSIERLPEELMAVAETRETILRRVADLPGYVFRYGGSPRDGARGLIDQLTICKEVLR
ncbi:MAG TPA: hypothetical protein VN577_07645 [Terriglobales bacterium]|nr:hypothetical protein [Terriglobales bacterium]